MTGSVIRGTQQSQQQKNLKKGAEYKKRTVPRPGMPDLRAPGPCGVQIFACNIPEETTKKRVPFLESTPLSRPHRPTADSGGMPRPWRQHRTMTEEEKRFVERQVEDVHKRKQTQVINQVVQSTLNSIIGFDGNFCGDHDETNFDSGLQLQQTEEGKQLLEARGLLKPAGQDGQPQTYRARAEEKTKQATTAGKLFKTVTGAPEPPVATAVRRDLSLFLYTQNSWATGH